MLFTKLRIFSSKLIPTGIHIPILRGILKGAKWIVISAAGEAKGLSTILNLSEPEQINFAMKLLRKNGICFDIVVNIVLIS